MVSVLVDFGEVVFSDVGDIFCSVGPSCDQEIILVESLIIPTTIYNRTLSPPYHVHVASIISCPVDGKEVSDSAVFITAGDIIMAVDFDPIEAHVLAPKDSVLYHHRISWLWHCYLAG